MKKSIALLLCLAMLALCGCSQDVSGSVAPADEPAQGAGGAAPAEEPAPDPTQEPAPAEEEPGEGLQLGTYGGGVYENQFLGIGCELDESWAYASKEELAQMVGLTADMFEDENLAGQIADADMFYDMYATADEGLVTINVLIQNMGILYGAAIDEEQYLEMSLESFNADMSSAGFADIEAEANTISFAGAQRQGLHVSSTIQDVPYYCQQVYIKQGSYMAVITLASFMEDICADFAEYFYALQ